VIAAIGLP